MNIQNGMIVVHNIESHGEQSPVWIVTIVDGEAWYYGGYSSQEKAERILKHLLQESPHLARMIVANPNMQDA